MRQALGDRDLRHRDVADVDRLGQAQQLADRRGQPARVIDGTASLSDARRSDGGSGAERNR